MAAVAPKRQHVSDLPDWARALEQRIVALEQQQRPRRVDPVADARLFGAIAITFGRAIFATVDLLASPSPELCAVLEGVESRVLGAWLKRLKARPIGGYVLRREGRDDRGALWSLSVSA